MIIVLFGVIYLILGSYLTDQDDTRNLGQMLLIISAVLFTLGGYYIRTIEEKRNAKNRG